MRIRVWGCRGSLATPGADTLRYGGNTSCVEVRGDSGEMLVLDAGTGMRPLGKRDEQRRRRANRRTAQPPPSRPPAGPWFLSPAL